MSGQRISARVAKKRAARAAQGQALVHDDTRSDKRVWRASALGHQERIVSVWQNWLRDENQSQKYAIIPGFELPPTVLIKSFVRYFVDSSTGTIAPQPSQKSVRMRMSNLWSAILRKTGTIVPDTVKNEIVAFIKHKLFQEGLVSNQSREKLGFQLEDNHHVQRTLWTEADLKKGRRTPREQVLLTALLHLLCFTGARIGAILPAWPTPGTAKESVLSTFRVSTENELYDEESRKSHQLELGRCLEEVKVLKGIRYQDITFWLKARGTKAPELVMSLSQSWIKANTDLQNGLKIALTLRDSFLNDAIPWFLAISFADGAFASYKSYNELCMQKIPVGREIFPLRWKDDMQKVHFFRPSPCSRDALTESWFRGRWNGWMTQSGYTASVTPHRIRQEVANVLDKAGITSSQRKQALGQTQSVFDQSYIHSLSSVDIQGLYLGEGARQDHIEALQAVSRERVVGYPTILPRKEIVARIDNHPEIQALIKRKGAAVIDQEIITLRKEICNLRQRIRKNALKNYQKEWLEQQYSTATSQDVQEQWEMSDMREEIRRRRFALSMKFYPHQVGIVAAIRGTVDYTDEVRLMLIQVITQLALQVDRIIYRPHEEPVGGRCPVELCTEELPRELGKQWTHIHTCRRLEAQRRFNEPVMYCYSCFAHITTSAWPSHCAEHLITPDIDCGVWTAGRSELLLKAGNCPFCMSNDSFSPDRRWRQVLQVRSLVEHLASHIRSVPTWPIICPHPTCSDSLESVETAYRHFENCHGLRDFSESALVRNSRQTSTKKRPVDEGGISVKRRRPNRATASSSVAYSAPAPSMSSFKTMADQNDCDPEFHAQASPQSLTSLPDLSELFGDWPDHPNTFFDVEDEKVDVLVDSAPSHKWTRSADKNLAVEFDLQTDFTAGSSLPKTLPQPLPCEKDLLAEWVSFPEQPMMPVTTAAVDCCPNCHTALPKGGAGLVVRERLESCPSCRQEEIQLKKAEWIANGYPGIDWTSLPARVRSWLPWATRCLSAQAIPTFRDLYSRTRTRTECGERPLGNDRLAERAQFGYYGFRGSSIVVEELIWGLTTTLKATAVFDPLVAFSPPQYVSGALAPAVIHRLIMEDMKQDEAVALETMRQSSVLGMYFNSSEELSSG